MYFLLRLIQLRRLRRITQEKQIKRIILALLVVMVCIILNSICFYYFERTQKPNLKLFDAFWLSFTTITTVGYGDFSASTIKGRLATIVLLYAAGLAIFPYVISQIIDVVIERGERRRRGLVNLENSIKNHIVIVNFPDEQKVQAIIEQLKIDPLTAKCPIVITAQEIDMLPFEGKDIYFIRGSPIEKETFIRANIKEAQAAVVLASRLEKGVSDAMTVASVSLIEELNPQIKTVAECTSVKHFDLFRSCRCDAIIPTEDIDAKLIAQEVRDPGVAPLVAELLSNLEGSELYSEVTDLAGYSFGDIQIALIKMKAQIIPIALIKSEPKGESPLLSPPKDEVVGERSEQRGEATVGERSEQKLMNPPPDTILEKNDRLVVISRERQDFAAIKADVKRRLESMASK
jgi:voltage-gated potassium channel